ncbi:ADR237Cp [Eremothecium gossypii ATCC 10895]|uniref:Protein-lysine N-methyltransferase n=1 Tax=Eremothecium gossypii (strain ATCC 10895 / CBS 109.51 / FGSC 9923 / NRRL Y-1056) TaxID=284811 RepID=Q759N8_EREGS|nr:ADR237Cp [Eremothecium gossypii ATCC 10895]AAS52157.2 ADR237Cp [Eremothecium gossypii ATCC 10895]AEY96456.1 FADR237Cp [Eremothecium gossypii FDAG1]
MTSGYQVQECLDWATANGAVIDDSLEFKITNSGISVFVKSRIEGRSQPLISIPKKLLITREMAIKSLGELGSKNLGPNALTQLFLAKLMFATDTGPKDAELQQFFKPYLSVLPTHKEMHTPYFWTNSELLLLRGMDIYLKAKKNLRQLVNEWHELVTAGELRNDTKFYDLFNSSENFDAGEYISNQLADPTTTDWTDFPAYLWASSIFSSRAFPTLILGTTTDLNEAFLNPIIDLLNHSAGTNVTWSYNEQVAAVTFSTAQTLETGDELYNNYGDKSNDELLLNYGFVLPNNEHDKSTLCFRIPSESISQAARVGVNLQAAYIFDDMISYELPVSGELSPSIVNLFSSLNMLKSEEFLTVRSTLEGLDQLSSILQQKIEALKSPTATLSNGSNHNAAKLFKLYKASQKKIFQAAFDSIPRLQKEIIKAHKPLSFKSVLKNDRLFANSALLALGVTSYDDMLKKGMERRLILLWLVRVGNKQSYKNTEYQLPDFIHTMFQEVKRNIVVDKDDVMEYMNFYKSLFPQLGSKIPEVYGTGDWSIKQFIVAGTVMDRLMWTRGTSREPLFFERKPFHQ